MTRRAHGRPRLTVPTLPLLRDDLIAHYDAQERVELDDMARAWERLHPDTTPPRVDLRDTPQT